MHTFTVTARGLGLVGCCTAGAAAIRSHVRPCRRQHREHRPFARASRLSSTKQLDAESSSLAAAVVPAMQGGAHRRRGRGAVGAVPCRAEGPVGVAQTVRNVVQEQPVTVFSKSWCPYCNQVKSALSKLGVEYRALELDDFVEEREIQDTLYEMTGRSTVPSVWIGGHHIGGCDDTLALMQSGELEKKLEAAGAL